MLILKFSHLPHPLVSQIFKQFFWAIFFFLYISLFSLFVIRLIMCGAPLLIPMKENLKRGISASRRLFCPVSDVLKGLIYHIV